MKTTLTLFTALLLAAISASALAMPCGEGQRPAQEIHNSQQQVRLHVALAAPAALNLTS